MQLSVPTHAELTMHAENVLRLNKMNKNDHEYVLTTMVIALVIDAIGSTKELKK